LANYYVILNLIERPLPLLLDLKFHQVGLNNLKKRKSKTLAFQWLLAFSQGWIRMYRIGMCEK